MEGNYVLAIKNFLADESGVGTLEYAMLAAILAAVAILIYGSGWGTSIKTTLNTAAGAGVSATL